MQFFQLKNIKAQFIECTFKNDSMTKTNQRNNFDKKDHSLMTEIQQEDATWNNVDVMGVKIRHGEVKL